MQWNFLSLHSWSEFPYHVYSRPCKVIVCSKRLGTWKEELNLNDLNVRTDEVQIEYKSNRKKRTVQPVKLCYTHDKKWCSLTRELLGPEMSFYYFKVAISKQKIKVPSITSIYFWVHPHRFDNSIPFPSVGHERCKILPHKTGVSL